MCNNNNLWYFIALHAIIIIGGPTDRAAYCAVRVARNSNYFVFVIHNYLSLFDATLVFCKPNDCCVVYALSSFSFFSAILTDFNIEKIPKHHIHVTIVRYTYRAQNVHKHKIIEILDVFRTRARSMTFESN